MMYPYINEWCIHTFIKQNVHILLSQVENHWAWQGSHSSWWWCVSMKLAVSTATPDMSSPTCAARRGHLAQVRKRSCASWLLLLFVECGGFARRGQGARWIAWVWRCQEISTLSVNINIIPCVNILIIFRSIASGHLQNQKNPVTKMFKHSVLLKMRDALFQLCSCLMCMQVKTTFFKCKKL